MRFILQKEKAMSAPTDTPKKAKPTSAEKVAELQKKIAEIKAIEQKKISRELTKSAKSSTAAETRMKILLGSFVLKYYESPISTFSVSEQKLSDYLVRTDDRALFGLAPSAPTPAPTKAPLSAPTVPHSQAPFPAPPQAPLSAPTVPHSQAPFPAPTKASLSSHTQSQKSGLICQPLKTHDSVGIRAGVPDFVHSSDEIFEHPSIPGLMLAREQRLYPFELEYLNKSTGKIEIEEDVDRRYRIKWQKPVPMTESSTSKDFVKMNPDIFKKKT